MHSAEIVTSKIRAVEVSIHAKRWMGPECKAALVLGVPLIAASKLSSFLAACRDLATEYRLTLND